MSRPAWMSAKPFEPGKYITVFSDASYCPNTGAYGWAFWAKYGHPAKTVVRHGGGMKCSGSLEAEELAIRAGLAFVESLQDEYLLQGKYLVVQSDCTGALARVQGDLVMMLGRLQLGRAYTKHVKGHRGHVDARASVNTTCDTLAGRQMRHMRKLHQKTQ